LDLNSAGDLSTIGAFAVVIIGGLFYWFGVRYPMTATTEWWATKHKDLGQVVVVKAMLTSRTRDTKTICDVALVKDPGWPRRLRGRFHAPELTPFYEPPTPWPNDYSPSVPATVPGKGEMEFKDLLGGKNYPTTKPDCGSRWESANSTSSSEDQRREVGSASASGANDLQLVRHEVAHNEWARR